MMKKICYMVAIFTVFAMATGCKPSDKAAETETVTDPDEITVTTGGTTTTTTTTAGTTTTTTTTETGTTNDDSSVEDSSSEEGGNEGDDSEGDDIEGGHDESEEIEEEVEEVNEEERLKKIEEEERLKKIEEEERLKKIKEEDRLKKEKEVIERRNEMVINVTRNNLPITITNEEDAKEVAKILVERDINSVAKTLVKSSGIFNEFVDAYLQKFKTNRVEGVTSLLNALDSGDEKAYEMVMNGVFGKNNVNLLYFTLASGSKTQVSNSVKDNSFSTMINRFKEFFPSYKAPWQEYLNKKQENELSVVDLFNKKLDQEQDSNDDLQYGY